MRTEASKTIRLAIPIIIGELAQMALHIIDTAMVGAISYKQLAAAALVVNAMNIPFVLGIGMTISVSQMVSMAHGRRDARSEEHTSEPSHLVISYAVFCLKKKKKEK